MMVPTLFKSVRSSSHEQSVPPCMNKPCKQPCWSWPGQSYWSSTMFKLASSTVFKLASSTMFKLASSTMFKLASSTMFKLASSTMFKLASLTMFKLVNRQKQAVRFYVCSRKLQRKLKINYLIWCLEIGGRLQPNFANFNLDFLSKHGESSNNRKCSSSDF